MKRNRKLTRTVAQTMAALLVCPLSMQPAIAGDYVPSSGGMAPTIATLGSTTTPIKHVVFIQKENRSFDEYFGQFPGANGATTGKMSNGTTVTLAQTPDPMPNDIDHSPGAWARAYALGKMNGFDREFGAFSSTGQPLAYSQMSESQIPNYWQYARTYALGDNMFANFKGASFANTLFMTAGQAGEFDSTLHNRSVFHVPQSPSIPPLPTWGCDNPPDTYVEMLGPSNTVTQKRPCFNFNSMPQELQANGISWRFYADRNAPSWVHVSVDALAPVRFDPAKWSNVVSLSQLYTDAANGTLPAVSWVEGDHSEHPPSSACQGENESVQMINAIMNGPDWASTAIVISYDEWGGFYDHVAPPQPSYVSYGFRVPLLVISPYTKVGSSSNGGYISHTLYSFASVLKFIEVNWSLPSLGARDATSNDMTDLFDFAAPQRPALLLQQRTCPGVTPAIQNLANLAEQSG